MFRAWPVTVCLSVGWTKPRALQNGDLGAVWDMDSSGPRGPCIGWARIPHVKGHFQGDIFAHTLACPRSGVGFIDSLVKTGKWSGGDQWVQETAGASEVSEEVMTRSRM